MLTFDGERQKGRRKNNVDNLYAARVRPVDAWHQTNDKIRSKISPG